MLSIQHSASSVRPYAELRTASAFSFLDSAALPEDLIAHGAMHDIPAMALIDRNGVYGAPRFFMAAKKSGIKAIIGAELIMEEEPERRHPAGWPGGILPPTSAAGSRQASRLEGGAPCRPRLTLLVENREGYKNLCKLVTAGAADRPKGDARYSWELIEQYASGLHCLTGGDEGPVAHALQHGGIANAETVVHRLTGIFPGRTHLELPRHFRRDEAHRNHALVGLARRMRLPLIATNGVRYARPVDKDLHDVLTCIREGRNVDTAGQLLGINRERHVKGAADMCALFPDLPQAIDGAWELSHTLEFTLANLGYQFPDYNLPPGESPMSFLRKIAWNAAMTRFRPMHERAQRQIEKELAMIEKLDLAGYFLIVWDIVQFCRREKILVQGRGSAANSAVCYP